MLDVGTNAANRQAAMEAARRAAAAAAAAAAAEAARQAAAAAAAAAAKAKQLEAAVKAEQQTDSLKAAGSAPLQGAGKSMEMGDVPWAAEDAAAKVAKAADFPTITADDIKAKPELGQRLAELSKDADPDVQAYVKDTTRELVKESLQRQLTDNPDDQELTGFKEDIADLSAKTGLGEVMKEVSGEALTSVAKDLLFKGVDATELADNPAAAKVLATLKDNQDPGVQDKLKETVRGWTDAALKKNMDGKEGEDDVKDGIKGFQTDLRALAEKTGLGDVLSAGAEASLNDQKDHIKDLADKGKPMWKKGLDLVGDLVGKAFDLGGDLVKGATDIAGNTVSAVTDAVADGVKQGTDLAGDLANTAIDAAGKGAHVVADVAASGLDAVGADSAANVTRKVGKHAEHAADVVGNVANAAIDAQGKVIGGAVDIAGNITSGALKTVGDTVNTVADGAGMLIAEGPMGAANKVADKVLGPEKALYAGQVDGFTGVITNRLGKGDSVFLNVEAGAEVGVGAFAGAKINGAGVLGRDGEGNITLALAVGVEAELGVSAETGATVNGIGAKADASASLKGQAMGKINLKFDPEDPGDVARLKALMEPTPAKLAGALTNPLALAAPSAMALKDAMDKNLTSTEISGSGGVSAGASAKASVGVAKAMVGADAEALAGATRKMNADGTNETKVFFKAGTKVEARASVGSVGVSGRAQAGALESFSVKTDAQGNITGLKSESSRSAGKSAGASVSKGFGAEGDGKVTKTETALNARGMDEAKRLIESGKSPMEAFSQASAAKENVDLVQTTMETDSYTIGVNAKVALAGVKIGVDATATIGKTHTESSRIDEPSAEDLNQILFR